MYNLSDEFVDNVIKVINKKESLKHKYYNTFTSIKNIETRLIKEFDKKSQNQLNYFYFNLIHKHNKNGALFNIKDEFGLLKFRDSLYFKNNKLEIKDNLLYKNKRTKFLDNKINIKNNKYYSRIKYIEQVNKHKKSIFITLTLPSEYHYYKTTKDGKRIKNNKCKFDDYSKCIKKGIEQINVIHRDFTKYVKIYLKRNNIKDNFNFIKVLENHKTNIVHLHKLYYIDQKSIEIFKQVFNIIVKKYDLKQVDFRLIDSKKSAPSSYITKYIFKNFKGDDIGSNFYKYYKDFYSTYRFLTFSNYKHTNQKEIDIVYKYLLQNKLKILKRWKSKNKSIFYEIEQLIKNKLFDFEYEKLDIKQLNTKKILKLYRQYSLYELFENINIEKDYYNNITIKTLTKCTYKNEILYEKLETFEDQNEYNRLLKILNENDLIKKV